MSATKPQQPTGFHEPLRERLDSWKEIAAYLKRDERTVRRWEKEGLPVHRKVHKTQASVYAYRTEIDSWWNNGRQRLEAVEPTPPARKPFMLWLLVGFVATGALILVAYYASSLRKERWARDRALPEISRLLDLNKRDKAFRLAREAERYIPNDPLLIRLMRSFTVAVSIQTKPSGADIYMRTYSANDEDLMYLGKSPLENVQVPWDYLRWKIAKPGFGTIEAATSILPNMNLPFTLDDAGTILPGMVHIPGGTFQFRSAARVELEPYWLDKHEVTNIQFKEFMERGGYQNRANWKQEFVRDGRRLSWELAMGQFRDSTGRVGPSTWELGSYPEGQAEFPVSGVSWFEAAAYCESVDKSLPTVYHWYKAAGIGIDSDVLHFSNFAGKGPTRVGEQQGLGPYGTYDLAGNVREWAWNESGAKRYILGGAWNEPNYMFATQDAQAPFGRSATSGFRCAKYGAPLATYLTRPIETLTRDYTREKPAPESEFTLYKSLYSYDRSDLDQRVESVDDSLSSWRREKISFRAPYGNERERVTAYLFLPRNARPPYSVVVYFPGVSSYFKRSSEAMSPEWVEFAVRSGRAVLYPIYMGTYERRINSVPSRQTPEEVMQPGSACLPVGPMAGRDLVAQWSKEMGRAIDYLETRKDIDSHRLAYYGLSLGAVWGPVLTALEPRFKASVLVGGGLPFERLPPEIEPLNFASRVKAPTLMLNGQDDFMFPVESSQKPLFHLLGLPNAEKRHVIFDSGHVPPSKPVVKESLDWLDRHLGPALTAEPPR
jgi:formylglycine-generating enzyme required for sulfatase activity/dienelactone hydrolase